MYRFIFSAFMAVSGLMVSSTGANAAVECSGFPLVVQSAGQVNVWVNPTTMTCYITLGYSTSPFPMNYNDTPKLLGSVRNPSPPAAPRILVGHAGVHSGLQSGSGAFLVTGGVTFTVKVIPPTTTVKEMEFSAVPFSNVNVGYVTATDPDVGEVTLQMNGITWDGPGHTVAIHSAHAWGGPYGRRPRAIGAQPPPPKKKNVDEPPLTPRRP